MMKWYKDRDFPEVKLSNSDIVAGIPDLKQLERVIAEQNKLVDLLTQSQEREAILRYALRFYAIEQSYKDIDIEVNSPAGKWSYQSKEVIEDDGIIAREALAKAEKVK